MNASPSSPLDELHSAMPLQAFLMLLLAAAAGALAAILVLPGWLPGLSASLDSSAPHAFWFLSRASALVAYLLLWLSMCLGMMITNKLARLWPGGPVAFDLHQHTSLLGVAFALFHGLILLGDQYIHTNLLHTVIPFGMKEYQPFWVGLGQLGFYLMVIVSFSFYVRKQITPRIWRLIHYLSFASFLMALAHGITSGSDTSAAWTQGMYWFTGGSFLFLFVFRLLGRLVKPTAARQTTLGTAEK
jgi:predicted ferric reductase